LETVVGAEPGESIQLAGSLEVPGVEASFESLVERALSERPDLEAARIRERLVGAQVELAEAEGVPDAVAFGRYTRGTARFDQFGLSSTGSPVPLADTDNTWTAGIAFNLPFSDKNQGNIEAALARRRAASLEREYLERVVRKEVRTAYGRLRATEQMVRLFDSQILNQSEANLEIVRTAYQFGELRLLDVVAEQRRLIDTERVYTAAVEQYRSAFVELERAVGGLLVGTPSIGEATDAGN
jgi:cobalt-zinc-cadmium efflux system outer membrane protein